MSDSSRPSHLDDEGRARMVDIGGKAETRRDAEAEAWVVFPATAWASLVDGATPKGGIVEPARIAGVMAAKRTAELIPLCHPLGLDDVQVDVNAAEDGSPRLLVRCRAATSARTGVEMEAMTGAAVAALTVYDMTKALDKGIRIEGLRLLAKSGGKSGRWQAE
jgi:cyclic pyranopterin phosphate synthase